MNVITSRPMYYSAEGPLPTAGVPKTDRENKQLFKGRFAKSGDDKAKKQLFKGRFAKSEEDKAKKSKEREGNKATRVSDRKEAKAERVVNREKRKAKRNAKKVLRLKDKTGRERILFPLTRLRKNKDGKSVKANPDGSETIVKPENVVTVSTIENTPTGPVKKTIEVDKVEVAEVLKVPIETVTPALIEQKKVEVPAGQAPVQAQETKVTGNENVMTVEIKESDIVADLNGVEYVSTQTQNEEEADVDVTDEKDKGKKGMSTTTKVIIVVGTVTVIALVVFAIYKSRKK